MGKRPPRRIGLWAGSEGLGDAFGEVVMGRAPAKGVGGEKIRLRGLI